MNRPISAVPVALLCLTACTSGPADDSQQHLSAPAGPSGPDMTAGGGTPAGSSGGSSDPWWVSEVALPADHDGAIRLVAHMPEELQGSPATRRERPSLVDLNYGPAELYLSVSFGNEVDDLTVLWEPGPNTRHLPHIVTGYDYESPDLAWHTGRTDQEVMVWLLDPTPGTMVFASAPSQRDLDLLLNEFIAAAG